MGSICLFVAVAENVSSLVCRNRRGCQHFIQPDDLREVAALNETRWLDLLTIGHGSGFSIHLSYLLFVFLETALTASRRVASSLGLKRHGTLKHEGYDLVSSDNWVRGICVAYRAGPEETFIDMFTEGLALTVFFRMILRLLLPSQLLVDC